MESSQIHPTAVLGGLQLPRQLVDELFPNLGPSEVLRPPGWKAKCREEGTQMTKHQHGAAACWPHLLKTWGPQRYCRHKGMSGKQRGPRRSHCSQQLGCMPILPHRMWANADVGEAGGTRLTLSPTAEGSPGLSLQLEASSSSLLTGAECSLLQVNQNPDHR